MQMEKYSTPKGIIGLDVETISGGVKNNAFLLGHDIM